MVEIVRGIYQVGGSEMSHGQDASVFLVQGPDRAVLIDAGAGRESEIIWNHIQQSRINPQDLSTLLLTHGHVDHIGGAAFFRDKTGCRILAHELDRQAIESGDPVRTGASWYGVTLPPVTVDRVLTGMAEEIPLGGAEKIICLHTPGHTPGSISPYLDRDGERILFGQDIHGPFLKEFGADLDDWRQSMQRLLELEADILCEGHFGNFYSKKAVRQFIEQYLRQHSRWGM
ncbi:MAG: MBL fold metallo-hydrolase [Desulfobacterota bacterium]|jgi:glyoxylase-like metal-dependent hydrolase (beta-lactamase superfamily II)|nr:MBL fold metallo-hydrolase [Thermodesulfobacteriota bacterium]